MQKYIKNAVLIMFGGAGTRIGTDRPKQYCDMKGRLLLQYRRKFTVNR